MDENEFYRPGRTGKCLCTLIPLEEIKAIVEVCDMTNYYEKLDGHFEIKH